MAQHTRPQPSSSSLRCYISLASIFMKKSKIFLVFFQWYWWSKNHVIWLDKGQWCNLTVVWQFWVTKVCLWASKISKKCLFGCLTGQVTFSHRLKSKTSQKYNRSIVILLRKLLWSFAKWFIKMSKKNNNIYILKFYTFYFVHIVKVCFVFKKQSSCQYSSVYA